MLRQHGDTHRLVNNIRAGRVNVGKDQPLNIREPECSQIRAPMDDRGQLPPRHIEYKRDAFGPEHNHAIGTSDHDPSFRPGAPFPGDLWREVRRRIE
jgi:hypothetical protein